MPARSPSPGTGCPSLSELREFILGQPGADAEYLERHLLECSRCSELAGSVSDDDPLVRAVRHSPRIPREEGVDTMAAELVTRLGGEAAEDLPGSNGVAVQAGPSCSAAEAPTYPFLAPPQAADEVGRLGGFRVLERLGAGGMGIVFRAEDPRLEREVALKVIKPERLADPGYHERFLREARAAAAIAHEHVVAVHQVDESGGVPYLVMPLLEGESLQDRLDRDGKLPIAEVLRIGREIAEGLAAAHERGLIHRDIKPANIWLEGRRGKVLVLDFGLARPRHDPAGMTHNGTLVGTSEYMAPEQAAGEPDRVDARADLFGLGVVLYVLCTGELPFRGRHPLAVLQALAVHQPARPRRLNQEVPEGLSRLIVRLLAKTPDERPASAGEVAEAAVHRRSRAARGRREAEAPRGMGARRGPGHGGDRYHYRA